LPSFSTKPPGGQLAGRRCDRRLAGRQFSPQGLDRSFLSAPIGLGLGGIEMEKPVLLWINDGLMAIFFFHDSRSSASCSWASSPAAAKPPSPVGPFRGHRAILPLFAFANAGSHSKD